MVLDIVLSNLPHINLSILDFKSKMRQGRKGCLPYINLSILDFKLRKFEVKFAVTPLKNHTYAVFYTSKGVAGKANSPQALAYGLFWEVQYLYYAFLINCLWHFGQETSIFFFLLGTRRLALQLGHFRYL